MSDADRIEELEERVAYLERELGLAVALDQVHEVRQALGVSQTHAHFLLALAQRRGRCLSCEQLDDRLPASAGQERSRNTIRAFALQIRRRLGADVLVTIEGGYRLGPRGLELVARALRASAAST